MGFPRPPLEVNSVLFTVMKHVLNSNVALQKIISASQVSKSLGLLTCQTVTLKHSKHIQGHFSGHAPSQATPHVKPWPQVSTCLLLKYCYCSKAFVDHLCWTCGAGETVSKIVPLLLHPRIWERRNTKAHKPIIKNTLE